MFAYSLKSIALGVYSSKMSLFRAKSLNKSKLIIQKPIKRGTKQSSRRNFRALFFKISVFSRHILYSRKVIFEKLPWVGLKETEGFALLTVVYAGT